jgi:hypothetical protein|tara:strand:+ start:1379 stop:2263 length:885 start_codon:yes stop_codon:yes gene_type:complete
MASYYGDSARWFIGVATNNLDPLQLGRVQVRIFGIHSRRTLDIPNYSLPWATVLQPNTAGGTSGIGMMPQILPGAQVFGMFLDGKTSQIPCILGVMPKIELPSEQQLSKQQDKAIQYDIGYEAGQIDPRLARYAGLTNNGYFTDELVGTERVEQAYNFFTSRGFTEKQSAGIVGNLIAESGPNLPEHGPRGDGGQAAGIAQWHPGRRKIFERVYGKPWWDNTFTDQLNFIVWELNNSDSESGSLNKNAGKLLKQTNTVAMAATIFDEKYERSSGEARQKRINYAHNVYNEFGRN